MIDSIEDNFTFNVNAPPSLELARCLQFTQAIQDELDSISNATAQNNPILCGMKTVLDALDRCDITSRALSGTLDQVDRQDMTTEIAHLKETVAAVDSECARHVSGFEDYKGRVRTLNTSVPLDESHRQVNVTNYATGGCAKNVNQGNPADKVNFGSTPGVAANPSIHTGFTVIPERAKALLNPRLQARMEKRTQLKSRGLRQSDLPACVIDAEIACQEPEDHERKDTDGREDPHQEPRAFCRDVPRHSVIPSRRSKPWFRHSYRLRRTAASVSCPCPGRKRARATFLRSQTVPT